MNIKTTDYDVDDFSTNDKLLFIPYDTNSDFNGLSKVSYTASSLPIYKLFKKEKLDADFAISNLDDCVFVKNHSIDWFGPTIFIPLMVISQNPNIVSFCLNIISNYVYDLFKGKNKDPSINCSFLYEDKQKKKKIEYEGPVSGLKEIEKIMKA